ncbi:MAG: hypothetical protein HN337_01400 [Deltaproteobacteria bacterium]|jgi:hypothetical protein|nr:hypothetical protein [Deltaproteobacteria bacterium]
MRKISLKTLRTNLLLIILSLLIFFGGLELLLSTGLLDGDENELPIWISEEDKLTNKLINSSKSDLTSKSMFGFYDKPRSITKPIGTYRIAVLGDSFIWGDGIDYDTIWSHKLENEFMELSDNIEVLSWGQCGWNTEIEYDYFKNYGHKYDIDLLVVGFVTNDPDMRRHRQKRLEIHNRKFTKPIRYIFPNAINFLGAYLDNIVYRLLDDWGYYNWEKKLYSDKNLKEYYRVLKGLSDFCKENDIELLFALTPNNYAEHFKWKYANLIPYLDEAEIEYLNLYPKVVDNLSEYSPRELMANPGNFHPGDLMTTLYSDEVFNYIKSKYQLPHFD